MKSMRHLLLLATAVATPPQAAIRFYALIRTFHGRFVLASNRSTVAIVARMRRRLTIPNAMVRTGK